MLNLTRDLVPRFKVITVPTDCSFGHLRHLIGVGFDFPTDLDVIIYSDDKPKTRLEVGNFHRFARTPKLVIEFDIEKSALLHFLQFVTCL